MQHIRLLAVDRGQDTFGKLSLAVEGMVRVALETVRRSALT